MKASGAKYLWERLRLTMSSQKLLPPKKHHPYPSPSKSCRLLDCIILWTFRKELIGRNHFILIKPLRHLRLGFLLDIIRDINPYSFQDIYQDCHVVTESSNWNGIWHHIKRANQIT